MIYAYNLFQEVWIQMDIVLQLHSLVRFLVLLAAVIGLLLVFFSMIAKGANQSATAMLASLFLGLLDLQALLGVLIILLGGLKGPLHPLVMFIALLIAHWLQTVVKRAQDSRVPVLRLVFYAVPLAIILFGLAIIGQLRLAG